MKNFLLKLLALCAGIAFWVIVITLENTFYVFPEDLEIQPFNLPENLSISDEIGKAKITLQVAPQAIKNISSKDFEVYIDLKNSAPGEHQAEVTVSSKNPEVKIVKIEPSIIKVSLQELTDRKIPIVAEVKGKPAEGFQIKEITLNKEELTLSGETDILSKLQEAKAVIKLSGQEKSNFNRKAKVVLSLPENIKANAVNTSITEVTAKVTIEEGLSTKTVGVKPLIDGSLDNAWLKSVKVNPPSIRIQGLNKNLQELDFLSTGSINISELHNRRNIKVFLKLPTGISLADGETNSIELTADFETVNVPQPPKPQPQEKPEPPQPQPEEKETKVTPAEKITPAEVTET